MAPVARSQRSLLWMEKAAPASNVAVILLQELLTDALTRPGGWTAKSLDSTLLAALNPPLPDGEAIPQGR